MCNELLFSSTTNYTFSYFSLYSNLWFYSQIKVIFVTVVHGSWGIFYNNKQFILLLNFVHEIPGVIYVMPVVDSGNGWALNPRIVSSSIFVKIYNRGASLAVQWLGLCLPVQRVRVRSLVGELRSQMPCSQGAKT